MTTQVYATEIVDLAKPGIEIGRFDDPPDLQVVVKKAVSLRPKALLGMGSQWVIGEGRYGDQRRATLDGRDYALVPAIQTIAGNLVQQTGGGTGCTRFEYFVALDMQSEALVSPGSC